MAKPWEKQQEESYQEWLHFWVWLGTQAEIDDELLPLATRQRWGDRARSFSLVMKDLDNKIDLPSARSKLAKGLATCLDRLVDAKVHSGEVVPASELRIWTQLLQTLDTADEYTRVSSGPTEGVGLENLTDEQLKLIEKAVDLLEKGP